jgi:hypothetical protein
MGREKEREREETERHRERERWGGRERDPHHKDEAMIRKKHIIYLTEAVTLPLTRI